jgi:lysozyme
VALPPPNRPLPAQSTKYAALLFGFLAAAEGIMLVARHDPIDPPGTIVYCMGATYPFERRPVKIGDRFTRDECEEIFHEDIPKYEAPLRKCINNFDAMPDHRKVAVVSASYNLGPSRVCKAVAPKLNAGDIKGACSALLNYVRSNGVVRRGLVKRRAMEQQWCLRDD